jgi:hypothetical protein
MVVKTATLILGLGLFGSSLHAAPFTFAAPLTGASESPPNASPGTGFALVTIDSVAHTLFISVNFSNLTAGNTAAHIHVINGPADANTSDTIGPVATTTPTFAGFPTGAITGTFVNTLDTTLASTYNAAFLTAAGGTTALSEAALFSGIADGRAYLNIHTSTFPGGEIRGFLVPIPEPGTWLVCALGMAGIGLRSRFRRRRLNL